MYKIHIYFYLEKRYRQDIQIKLEGGCGRKEGRKGKRRKEGEGEKS